MKNTSFNDLEKLKKLIKLKNQIDMLLNYIMKMKIYFLRKMISREKN